MTRPMHLVEIEPAAEGIEEKLWRKHEVTMEEVEEAVDQRTEFRALGKDEHGEMRYRVVGRTLDGRWLTVILVRRGPDRAAVLSARDATSRERRSAKKGRAWMPRQIPHFDSLEEESEFWDNVDTTDFIDWNEPPIELVFGGRMAERVAEIERQKKSISMRMEVGMLNRLRRIARRRSIGYQTLMRMWIAERLEQEERAKEPTEETKVAAGV